MLEWWWSGMLRLSLEGPRRLEGTAAFLMVLGLEGLAGTWFGGL